MLKRPRVMGFTLIELMIALAVFSILTALAMPAFTAWIANNKVRTVAEALQNDLRQAQGEAIKRSRRVAFALTSSTPTLFAAPSVTGPYWYMQTIPLTDGSDTAATYLRGNTAAKQNGVGVSGVAMLCFNAVGGLVGDAVSGLGTCSAPSGATPVLFALTASGSDRPLNVQVALGGQVRLCDPAKSLSSDHPDGC